ncbi:MAG: hypothetical protein IH899_04750 [Planctomycetes bacterium]|nr:hypothetical protein [Planctomycetota bacterium]
MPVEQFRQALKDAVAAQQNDPHVGGSLSWGASAEKSIEQFFPEELFQPVLAPPQNITFQDGNNRSVETAMMDMRKNAAMQRFAIEVITAQLNMLQTVISERA